MNKNTSSGMIKLFSQLKSPKKVTVSYLYLGNNKNSVQEFNLRC